MADKRIIGQEGKLFVTGLLVNGDSLIGFQTQGMLGDIRTATDGDGKSVQSR